MPLAGTVHWAVRPPHFPSSVPATLHRPIVPWTPTGGAGCSCRAKVVVRTDGDATIVEALDPHVMVGVTGEPALKAVADEAGRRLAAALDALAG